MLEKRRKLLTAASLAVLTTGCAQKDVRYEAAVARFETRRTADKANLKSIKTITLLAPSTDIRLDVGVVPSVLTLPGTSRALRARRDEFREQICAAFEGRSLVSILAEAVAQQLEEAGFVVKVLYGDQYVANRQAIQDANFGTDMTYALYQPNFGITVDVKGVGRDHYYPFGDSYVVAVRDHQAMTFNNRRKFPDSTDHKRPYWIGEPKDEPHRVRFAVNYMAKELADRLTLPIRADSLPSTPVDSFEKPGMFPWKRAKKESAE